MLNKDKAICIRATDYSETSQVVTFFTGFHGKVSAIAKGAKRAKSAFDGPVEIFSHGKIVFSDSRGEKLATLTEFEQHRGFPALARNLYCLHCASFAAELVNLMTHDSDPHPELFDSFLQFLQNLGDISRPDCKKRDALVLLLLFQLNLLKEVGLQPILSSCSNCKNEFTVKWRQSFFSHSADGLLCKDCEASFPDRIRISSGCANILSNIKTLPEAGDETLYEAQKILISHFTGILHRAPKMAKHILKT
ncbi:DNA repair protein RecO [Planctomycetota bacterium]